MNEKVSVNVNVKDFKGTGLTGDGVAELKREERKWRLFRSLDSVVFGRKSCARRGVQRCLRQISPHVATGLSVLEGLRPGRHSPEK